MRAPLCPPTTATLRPIVTARILYADIDRMGIVYHANYFRYLELARIELLRAAGLSYIQLEESGLALPLVETAVRFIKPAQYDDLITIFAGMSLVTRVRLNVQYRVIVAAGDREGLTAPIDILTAQTRHCCVLRDGTRPARLPEQAWQVLSAAV